MQTLFAAPATHVSKKGVRPAHAASHGMRTLYVAGATGVLR